MLLSCRTRALVCLNLLLLLPALCLLGDPPPGPQPALPKPAVKQGPAEGLRLQWVRQESPPVPAWPDQPRLQFDVAPRPVVLGKTLFMGCTRTDSLVALDLDTGSEKWRFITDGPVRFAPAVWQDRVFCVSDDGYLYCVDAAKGMLLWKFRGGPSERKVLGNGRLISTWPARGGPVIAEGTVYFAAGIWPFMGVFLHALDARTGEVVWSNSGDGSIFMVQPHYADSFAGIAPQGALVVAGDRLLVPCGRSVPACYDRKTGKLLYYRLAASDETGGSEVRANEKLFINDGSVFDLATGHHQGSIGEHAVFGGGLLYGCSGNELRACEVKEAAGDAGEDSSWRTSWPTWSLTKLGSVTGLPKIEALTCAGTCLFVGMADRVGALALPLRDGKAEFGWQANIEGHPVHLLVAEDRLVVSTREGRLYCFGPRGRTAFPGRPADGQGRPSYPKGTEANWEEKARHLLQTAGARDGYCIAWGGGTGGLITEIARQSKLHIIVVEPDPERAVTLRRRWIEAGLYGDRIALLACDWQQVELPAYLASLMVSEDLLSAGVALSTAFLQKAFSALRPFGGVACLPVPKAQGEKVSRSDIAASLPNGRLTQAGPWLLLRREGALPGSANWTHEHADAANTRVSQDRLVKAPLGLLWFGGTSHQGVLPRHGHGPQPQVIDGRLIIEGPDKLRAVDIYTGRLLWESELPGVGKDYDSTWHQAGANATGGNYVSTSEGIYVAHLHGCLRLDPATGKQVGEFALPLLPGETQPPSWSYLNVCADCLVGGANPPVRATTGWSSTISSSKRLTVLDLRSGKVLWSRTAQSGFRHNAICIGGGRLYCIDRPSEDQQLSSKRHGEVPEARPQLLALDLRTGKELWSNSAEVFGTWLSWSAQHDVLVEAGRMGQDTNYDEARGMRAYAAGRGSVLWHRPDYSGPVMIHGDMILKDQSACELLTGKPILRPDPLTGEPVEWTWKRDYGCNTPAASEHLLTFRSGAAGYYDLANDGGTGNFGGFRSGCTNNLIVAGGVLTAPDYTRTCTCSYQNQASLALVPMPEAEMWTWFGRREIKDVVRRAGINLGAPGSRKANDGTLWLEYPPVGGPSPRLPITVTPANPDWFRQHSSLVEGKWVGASGVKGLTSLTITLAGEGAAERLYTIRLHFVEPDRLRAGERVFHVALQGRTVLSDFDISKEAGGSGRSLVKEFHGIKVGKDLTVTLTPADEAGDNAPVLCGMEVVAEGW